MRLREGASSDSVAVSAHIDYRRGGVFAGVCEYIFHTLAAVADKVNRFVADNKNWLAFTDSGGEFFFELVHLFIGVIWLAEVAFFNAEHNERHAAYFF